MRLAPRFVSLVAVTLLAVAIPFCPISSFLFPAIAQVKTAQDRKAEADRLFEQGNTLLGQNQNQAAIASFQQALAIYRKLKDRQSEGKTLKTIGNSYRNLKEYAKAIDYQQQALAIARILSDHDLEARALNNLGLAYRDAGNINRGLEFFHQAEAIAQHNQNQRVQLIALNNLGIAYVKLGNYTKAIAYAQQHLAIARKMHDRQNEGAALGNLGITYRNLGNYVKAIEYEQQWLGITQEIHDRRNEGAALGNLGIAYLNLGNYAKAIEYEQQWLAIAREVKDHQSEGKALGNLGIAYLNLGNYAKAIEYEQQLLAIAREIGDKESEGKALGNLGIAYLNLGNYAKAIEYEQQHLAIAREIHDRQSEGKALGNLGIAYDALGNHAKAIEHHQQALTISREIHDRPSEGVTLGNLGDTYNSLGNYAKAIEYEQQLLAIAREIGDRESEGIVLSNIGVTLAKQQQPELAIVFYKQSVNVRESIRVDIRKLAREQQEAYTQTVAGTYRALADLLLSQGRIAEAQQVLELLKIQELRDYTHNTRAGGTTAGIALATIEANVAKEHGTLIAFGQKVDTCKQTNCNQLDRLLAERSRQNQAFAAVVKELTAQVSQRSTLDKDFLDPKDDFRREAERIVAAQPGTLLIYPLVLPDKLWLLVGSAGPVFTRYEIKVTEKELAETVLEFRHQMKACETRPCTAADTKAMQQVSQKLYHWLFPPEFQQNLQGSQQHPIRHLVFAPDRVTRYIPMAALFDGSHYLIEQYTVGTIVSAKLTDTNKPPRLDPQAASILAMGLSDSMSGYNSLPNVPLELAAIVHAKDTQTQGIYPGQEFLNQTFTYKALQANLSRHQILHIATHGQFVPGQFESSYLLLGDGNKLPIPDIKNLDDLIGVNLVVLSACETALGGRREQDGIEIAGISNAFLERGTKAVLASLWQVSDSSTSLLMQRFYQKLASGQFTKAEALQQAQLSLLKGESPGKDANTPRASARPLVPGQSAPGDFSHPYYWAPFILIGNGL